MNLHAVVDGSSDAAPVVLAPSLGTTTAMWDEQVGALAEHFRVVRFDHPGHGGSATEPVPRTIADLGARVLSLLDELGIERASYVGLSLGGMVGMWLAAHAPERVDRLALLCTSALLGPSEYWLGRARTVTAEGMAVIVGPVVERWFTAGFHERQPQLYARYRAMLEGIDPAGYAACCAVIAGMDLRAALPRIQADTLVIAGAADTAIPVEQMADIASALARGRLELVADAAHLANVEQPEVVTALLFDHLRVQGEGTAT